MPVPAPQVGPPVISELQVTEAGAPVRACESDLERAVEVFLAERTHLFWIAYRIVGDVAGAEDVVQEAWLRWQRSPRSEIKSPGAFLNTVVTHLAINVVQSAGWRHETPTDAPLMELVDPAQDPTMQVELTAEIERALSLLMVRLTPSERAAYLLRKGFDYPYRDVARVLRTTVSNARQLVRRAHCGLDRTSRRPVDPAVHRRLVCAFVTAAQTGDFVDLEHMLADDACVVSHRIPTPPPAVRAGRERNLSLNGSSRANHT